MKVMTCLTSLSALIITTNTSHVSASLSRAIRLSSRSLVFTIEARPAHRNRANVIEMARQPRSRWRLKTLVPNPRTARTRIIRQLPVTASTCVSRWTKMNSTKNGKVNPTAKIVKVYLSRKLMKKETTIPTTIMAPGYLIECDLRTI